MKIEILKDGHPEYTKGVHDVTDERANYLIMVGAAKETKAKDTKEDKPKSKK